MVANLLGQKIVCWTVRKTLSVQNIVWYGPEPLVQLVMMQLQASFDISCACIPSTIHKKTVKY